MTATVALTVPAIVEINASGCSAANALSLRAARRSGGGRGPMKNTTCALSSTNGGSSSQCFRFKREYQFNAAPFVQVVV